MWLLPEKLTGNAEIRGNSKLCILWRFTVVIVVSFLTCSVKNCAYMCICVTYCVSKQSKKRYLCFKLYVSTSCLLGLSHKLTMEAYSDMPTNSGMSVMNPSIIRYVDLVLWRCWYKLGVHEDEYVLMYVSIYLHLYCVRKTITTISHALNIIRIMLDLSSM